MLTSFSCLFQPLLCSTHVRKSTRAVLWILRNASRKPLHLTSLEPNKLYPIIRAKRTTTKYGHTVLLSLRVSKTSIVQVFLPKRYSDVMSDEDMESINSKAVSLNLVYRGVCESSKSYLLSIEWDLKVKFFTVRTVSMQPKRLGQKQYCRTCSVVDTFHTCETGSSRLCESLIKNIPRTRYLLCSCRDIPCLYCGCNQFVLYGQP